MISKKEILKKLRSENIYLGKDPYRTFALYEEKGLLPEPEAYRQNEPFYPDNTPCIFKNILFAQQVEKRTVSDIIREQRSGSEVRKEGLKRLGLEEEPLNFYSSHLHHGKYGSKDSDILVAMCRTEIIFYLLEGLRGGFFQSPHAEPRDLRILKEVRISFEEYGNFIKERAIRRVTAEGKLFEETHLFEILFG